MKKNDAMILTLTIKALVFSLSICCKHTLIHHLLKKTVYAAILVIFCVKLPFCLCCHLMMAPQASFQQLDSEGIRLLGQ